MVDQVALRQKARPARRRSELDLNSKQMAFVEAFVRSDNGTQSALAAGYSTKTAGVQAHALLKLPKIKAAVARRREIIQRETELKSNMTRNWMLERLARVIDIDPDEIAEWVGNSMSLHDSKGVPADVRKTIQSISIGKHGPSFKTADRLKAMELAMDLLGYRKNRHEISGPGGAAIRFYLPSNGREQPISKSDDEESESVDGDENE